MALLPQEPPTVLAGTMLQGTSIDRFASFWRRLRHATFHSPGKLVVEIEDKYNTARHYISTLELVGFEWKLTALRRSAGADLCAASSAPDSRPEPPGPPSADELLNQSQPSLRRQLRRDR